MKKNNKGAALLQVLMVTVIIAGMAAMLLRVGLSRATQARKNRRETVSQLLINSCQAEVNMLWSMKKPEIFARDLSICAMTCSLGLEAEHASTCGSTAALSEDRNIPFSDVQDRETEQLKRTFSCSTRTINGVTYGVTAYFSSEVPNINGQCDLTYRLTDNLDGSEVVL